MMKFWSACLTFLTVSSLYSLVSARCGCGGTVSCTSPPNGCVCRENNQITLCNFDACCNRRRVRRHLLSGRVLEQTDQDYKSEVDRCGSYKYDVVLYVGTHFFAAAFPKEDAIAAGCPYAVTQSKFVDGKGVAQKELVVFDKEDHAKSMVGDGDSSLLIGTFMLADIARAYEASEPGSSGVFNIVTNNCADYMIELAANLGVSIDSKMLSFVTRRLLEENGKELFDTIRKSMSFKSLFSHRFLRTESVSDKDVLDLLVDAHLSFQI